MISEVPKEPSAPSFSRKRPKHWPNSGPRELPRGMVRFPAPPRNSGGFGDGEVNGGGFCGKPLWRDMAIRADIWHSELGASKCQVCVIRFGI